MPSFFAGIPSEPTAGIPPEILDSILAGLHGVIQKKKN